MFVDVPGSNTRTNFYRLKFHIRQECAVAITRVLEAYASTGIVCRLRNVRGVDTTRLLFPRLMSMNFDQPETQLFFGHQNKQTCTHCRRRKGRSAFRLSRPQVGSTVQRLYDIVNAPDRGLQSAARKKLKRWGFNYQRRCLIPTVCRNLLIRLPGTDEVFAHLDYRDFLHGVVMFLGHMFCELLDYIPFDQPLS